MTDEQRKWLADLKEMITYLEDHPVLIDSGDCVVHLLAEPRPEDLAKVLALLPEKDVTGDPAMRFGKHWMYLPKRYTHEGKMEKMIKELQEIVTDTA